MRVSLFWMPAVRIFTAQATGGGHGELLPIHFPAARVYLILLVRALKRSQKK
jgi:hypothetical protein